MRSGTGLRSPASADCLIVWAVVRGDNYGGRFGLPNRHATRWSQEVRQARFLKAKTRLMMGELVKQRRRHLGIAGKDTRPFAESKVGGDYNGGALVERADEMEGKLPVGLSKGRYPPLSSTLTLWNNSVLALRATVGAPAAEILTRFVEEDAAPLRNGEPECNALFQVPAFISAGVPVRRCQDTKPVSGECLVVEVLYVHRRA